jgi:hypothetical protein
LSDEQRLVLAVTSAVRLADVRALAEADDAGMRRELDTLLGDWSAMLSELAYVVSHKYLVHSGPAHQLAGISRG